MKKHVGTVAGIVAAATAIVGIAIPSSALSQAPLTGSTEAVAIPTSIEVVSQAWGEVPLSSVAIQRLASGLDASGVPTTTSLTTLEVRSTYTLESGSQVVVTRPRGGSGVVAPQFSVGIGWGLYVYLNRVDQAAVLAGGGAALAAAICLIPAVGNAACVAVVGLVAMAGVYLYEYGRCPTAKPRLELHAGSTPKCLK